MLLSKPYECRNRICKIKSTGSSYLNGRTMLCGYLVPNDIAITGCYPIGSRPDALEEESRLI